MPDTTDTIEIEEERELLDWRTLVGLAKDEGVFEKGMNKEAVVAALLAANIDPYKDEEGVDPTDETDLPEIVLTEEEGILANQMEESNLVALIPIADKLGINPEDKTKTRLIEEILLAERGETAKREEAVKARQEARTAVPTPITLPDDPAHNSESGELTLSLQDLAIALSVFLPEGTIIRHHHTETFSRTAHFRSPGVVGFNLPDELGHGRRYELSLPETVTVPALKQ